MIRALILSASILLAGCGSGGGGGGSSGGGSGLPTGHPGVGDWTATKLSSDGTLAGEAATTSAAFTASQITVSTVLVGSITVPYPGGDWTNGTRNMSVTWHASSQRLEVRNQGGGGAVYTIAPRAPSGKG